jgi:hypothetical protein
MYRWLSLSRVLKYENEMIKEKVSEVARGKNGFLSQYKIYKTADAMRNAPVPYQNQYWEQKRNAYLARSIPQYLSNPTYRRKLSLIAWAYYP